MGYGLQIAVWGRSWTKMGVLGLKFADIEVEDITPKIRKYLPPGGDARSYISRVSRDPEYYVSKYRKRLAKAREI
jgi:hypothetical protein